MAQDERLDTGYAPDVKYLEALASKGMEWMDDLSPSQMITAAMCSSL